MFESWKKEPIADVVNFLLGFVLFLSPWMFGFAGETAAPWNAWVSGIVIAGLAIAALTAFATWEEWLEFVVGLWVALSPWLVGFAANTTAVGVHLVIGILVAALAAMRLWFTHGGTPRVTA